jgi:HEAT repeat protein
MTGVGDLVESFRAAAITKADFSGQPKDGELFARMREAVSALREWGPSGEAALRALLGDSSPHVRSWVAADLLMRGDPDARRVLYELSSLSGPLALSASTTLREFDAGRLCPPF